MINEIKVGLDFGTEIHQVGRLAIRNRVIYFQYDAEFLQKGLELSPFRLPLQESLFQLPDKPFEGLAGVFSDSLPDGWGRLLFDRIARKQGVLPATLSPLDRLAHVGMHGMGALVYEPDQSPEVVTKPINLDQLASKTIEVMKGEATDVLETLIRLNGSSAGARPKALIALNAERTEATYGATKLEKHLTAWLAKFPNLQDGNDAGAIEYVYALMAEKAGIDMPPVHLFPSEIGAGFFTVQRFDRKGNKRFHMHSAAGLLHSDFRAPSLDYEDLLNVTRVLTRDIREVEKMYRLAVFNVLSHNRDDHAKNFSFLMDQAGEWKLSPAYDLNFSSGPNGEQSTMVLGEGQNPSIKDLRKLGKIAGFSKKLIEETIEQTRNALDDWEPLARHFEVKKENIALISKKLAEHSSKK